MLSTIAFKRLVATGSNISPCLSSGFLAGSSRRPPSRITLNRCASSKAKKRDIWKHAETARLIWASKTTDFPATKLPEVLFTGRSNAGKSSVIGTILGRGSLVSTSRKAGHTKSLAFYRVGPEPGDAILVDTPGYGAIGRGEWGAQFDHYLETREQLKRVYIVLNLRNGFNRYDEMMMEMLASKMIQDGVQKFTLQAVINKADTVDAESLRPAVETMRKQIWDAAPLCLPPIITSATMVPPFGIDKLRQNIAEACAILP